LQKKSKIFNNSKNSLNFPKFYINRNPINRANSASSSCSLFIKIDPPKDITSKSWVLYNVHTNQIISGKKHHNSREIASLTKIMTCYIAISLSNRFSLNLSEFTIKITRFSSTMIGTSADLLEGDQLRLIDLLHALMLPSGNDAAYAIAESFGCLLYYDINNKTRLSEISQNHLISVTNELINIVDPLRYFLNEMNRTAKELKLYNTSFANPHGLMNRNNKSTASDVAKLACIALKNAIFLQIVNKKLYECTIKNDKYLKNRKKTWFNTNKMLDKGYIGIKTGITDAAGPCLVTSLKLNQNDKEIWAICVILGCRNMEKRWEECEELLKFGIKQIFMKNNKENLIKKTIKNPKFHNI